MDLFLVKDIEKTSIFPGGHGTVCASQISTGITYEFRSDAVDEPQDETHALPSTPFGLYSNRVLSPMPL